MSDEEDVIDKLENESRKKNDDSDEESDEEYKIEEKEKDDDDEDEDGENKNKDKVDWRKATPEEVFKRFDEDNSGAIDFEEFKIMLPELNVKLSEAKALKYFRQCDTDGSGEIGLDELKVALFMTDPNSGNSVGFKPSSILSPKDAFEMYDEDGSGNLDEDEFSLALEYMEMPVDDAKLEYLFHKADADGSGSVEYHEFKKIWLELVNPRKELEKRDVELPLFMTPWALKEKLAEVVEAEEDQEAHAIATAEAFRTHMINLAQKKVDVAAALKRAHIELGNALDVAGQVYLFGSGTRGQFLHGAVRPGQVFDGFKEVDETFTKRVAPNGPPVDFQVARISDELAKQGALHVYGSTKEKKKNNEMDPDASYFDNVYCATHCSTLWGRGVTEVGIGENTAFACNKFGEIFGWGGRKHLWEKILPGSRWARENRGEMTHRSQVLLGIKGRLPWLAQEIVRERAREARRLEKLEEDEKLSKEDLIFKKLKIVSEYYGVFKPPQGNVHDKVKYMRDNILPLLEQKVLLFTLEVRNHAKLGKNKNNEQLCFAIYDDLKFELKMIGGSEQKRLKTIEFEAYDFRKRGNREKATKFTEEIKEVWEVLGIKQQEERERHARRKYQREKREYLKLERRYKLWRQREAEGDVDYADRTERGGGRVVVGGITERGPGPTITPMGGRVKTIGVGAHHVIAAHHAGDLYAWGDSTFGRLGIPSDDVDPNARVERTVPTLVEAIKGRGAKKIAAGYSHNIAIVKGDQLYVWGGVASGKLGIGPIAQEFEAYVQYPIPLPLPGDRRVRTVSCGNSHSAAVCMSGELFVWGSGDGGRLGLGSGDGQKIHPRPTLVEYLVGMDVMVTLVACGSAHTVISLVVKKRTRGTGHTQIIEYTGGELLQCGAAAAIGKFRPRFEVINKMKDKPVKSLACGNNHSAAVTVYGEVYTWGSNNHGCSGHPTSCRFNYEPTVIKCLFVSSESLGLNRPSELSSVYNKREAILANNGDNNGDGEDKCVHTQMDQNPWWEVDMGRLAVVHTIVLWNREDIPADPSLGPDYYSRRLFPCWIMISASPFEKGTGGDNLSGSFNMAVARKKFTAVKRRTTWSLPVNTVGRYVRVQLESTNYLHFAQCQIFGTWGTAKSVGPADRVYCGAQNTAVVIDVDKDPDEVELCYKRAVQADPYNAHILRQYKEYYGHYDEYGENISAKVKCLTCRGGVKCELCVLRHSWPVEKCRGYVKRAPGGRVLRLKEIAHLILEDPVKPVKWHHKKKRKKSLFGSSTTQKQEYEEDDDEDDEDEQKTIEEKLLEEDQEKMIMNVDEMNAADLELMLEDDMDEESDDGEKIEEVQKLLKEAEEIKAAQGIVGKVGSISASGLFSPHSNNDEGKEGETVLNDEDGSKKKKKRSFFSRLFGTGRKEERKNEEKNGENEGKKQDFGDETKTNDDNVSNDGSETGSVNSKGSKGSRDSKGSRGSRSSRGSTDSKGKRKKKKKKKSKRKSEESSHKSTKK